METIAELTIYGNENSALHSNRLRQFTSEIVDIINRKWSQVGGEFVRLLVIRNAESTSERNIQGSKLSAAEARDTNGSVSTWCFRLHRIQEIYIEIRHIEE
jgi:hypothetical protein